MGKKVKFQGADLSLKCTGRIEVPTEKEREALAAMKSIKDHVREAKERLRCLRDSYSDESVEEIERLEDELAQLKTHWNMWEEKRKEAAQERMILLGHEKD